MTASHLAPKPETRLFEEKQRLLGKAVLNYVAEFGERPSEEVFLRMNEDAALMAQVICAAENDDFQPPEADNDNQAPEQDEAER